MEALPPEPGVVAVAEVPAEWVSEKSFTLADLQHFFCKLYFTLCSQSFDIMIVLKNDIMIDLKIIKCSALNQF